MIVTKPGFSPGLKPRFVPPYGPDIWNCLLYCQDLCFIRLNNVYLTNHTIVGAMNLLDRNQDLHLERQLVQVAALSKGKDKYFF